jgi:Protein of unknown function (DUF3467)
MSDAKTVPMKITIDDAVADGRYVNFANILHSPTEFVIDFGRLVPGRPDAKVLTRILTTPFHAKQFLRALQQNIDIYERQFGEIRDLTPLPASEASGTKTN